MSRALFKHQQEGAAFLKRVKKGVLAHDMGLGKTFTSITVANEEMERGTLIICPASLKVNWEREVHMVVPGDTVHVVESGPFAEIPEARWVIVNYDMLEKYQDHILSLIHSGYIDTVIVDEAHYIKGDTTIRAKNVLALSKVVKRLYLLTGTPMLNRPIELFPLLKAVGHPLGKVKTTYAIKFCGAVKKCVVQEIKTGKRFFVSPQKAFGYRRRKDLYRVFTFMDMQGATSLTELRESIKSVMQRRLKRDAIDLPEKIITENNCLLDNEWMARYESAFDDYIAWLESHPDPEKNIDNILMTKHLVEIQKVKQVCSLAKVDIVCDDIRNAIDQNQKVIVFSQYTETIKTIAQAFRGASVTLTGEDNQEERQRAVDAFQTDPNIKVFVGNIKAGGVGLNLTAASIVMFADMDWSPEVHAQAEDRAHRIGQNGTVNVYYYVAEGTIEEDIMDMLEQKRKVIKEILEGESENVKIASNQKEFMQRMREKVFG